MASRSNSIPRICACGCNGVTRGGEFKPGHDAKLRGHFLRRIDNGDEKAIAELLNERPKLAFPYGYTEANYETDWSLGGAATVLSSAMIASGAYNVVSR